MSSTFKIIQDECIGCGTCENCSNHLIMINDKGKACFAKNEGSEANFGGHDASLIFLAMDNCPTECIKEIG